MPTPGISQAPGKVCSCIQDHCSDPSHQPGPCRALGQDKLWAALVLLSAFCLAAHDDFVPVSPCLEATQGLGILSIRRVSLLTTGGGK